jgi:hypothetical protein
MKTKLISAWLVATFAAFGQLQTGSIQVDTTALNGSGAISGTVDGIPPGKVESVRITAVRTAPASPLATAAINASKDGTFTLTQLPAGIYKVCLYSPDGDYVDPCAWGLTPPTFTVAANQQLKGMKYSLVPGVRLKTRIDDPNGSLQKKTTDVNPQHVLVAIASTKGLLPMPVVKSNPSGLDHEIVIPVSVALKLNIFSKGVDIEDDKKVTIPANGLQRDITQSSLAAQPNFVFTVKGRKP